MEDVDVLWADGVSVDQYQALLVKKHVVQESVQNHGEQGGHGLAQNFPFLHVRSLYSAVNLMLAEVFRE